MGGGDAPPAEGGVVIEGGEGDFDDNGAPEGEPNFNRVEGAGAGAGGGSGRPPMGDRGGRGGPRRGGRGGPGGRGGRGGGRDRGPRR